MAFSDDVFISYAHLDNQALTAGSEYWAAVGQRSPTLQGRTDAGQARGEC